MLKIVIVILIYNRHKHYILFSVYVYNIREHTVDRRVLKHV
jgi:hypothetical protein